jgi:CRP-like cAMP-binding protein
MMAASEAGGWQIFAGMAADDVGAVLAACRRRTLAAGDVLSPGSSEEESLYIVASGRLEAFKAIREGVDQVLESFVAGEVLGVATFLDGARHPAGARAAEPSELLILSRRAFEQAQGGRAGVAAAFYRNLAGILAGRLRGTLELYRDAVQFGIEATGASALSLGTLVEGLRPVTVHLDGGVALTGQLLQLDRNPAGFTLVIKDRAGKFTVVPYHAIQRIEVG